MQSCSFYQNYNLLIEQSLTVKGSRVASVVINTNLTLFSSVSILFTYTYGTMINNNTNKKNRRRYIMSQLINNIFKCLRLIVWHDIWCFQYDTHTQTTKLF